jgi:sulfocyanin SoxE-like protein
MNPLAAVATLALLVPAASKPPPKSLLHVDKRARKAAIALIAGYNGNNSGFNFDGYSRGELRVIVPLGWRVVVRCSNHSAIRHSCAVVRGPMSVKPAFKGAYTPNPQRGLGPGESKSFSFRATRTGAFRLACLVPGHEDARMWDLLKVVRHGRPTIAARPGP